MTVGDDPLTATVIMKSLFKEMKNDSIDREPMVACIHCGRRMHTICVLHMDQIYHGGFQCDECLRIKGQTRKENKFSAKSESCARMCVCVCVCVCVTNLCLVMVIIVKALSLQ